MLFNSFVASEIRDRSINWLCVSSFRQSPDIALEYEVLVCSTDSIYPEECGGVHHLDFRNSRPKNRRWSAFMQYSNRSMAREHTYNLCTNNDTTRDPFDARTPTLRIRLCVPSGTCILMSGYSCTVAEVRQIKVLGKSFLLFADDTRLSSASN